MRYLVRTLIGNLRVGAGSRTVIAALGRAAASHRYAEVQKTCPADVLSKASAAAQTCFDLCPSLDVLLPELMARDVELSHVLDIAKRVGVRVGTPVRPMLAKPSTGPGMVAAKVGWPMVGEWKYDGQRCQVCVLGGCRCVVICMMICGYS